MGAPCLEAPKASLDGTLGILIWWVQLHTWQGAGTGWALRSHPTQRSTTHFVILWACDL